MAVSVSNVESDCEDEVNFDMFAGKSFYFVGFPEEKEMTFTKIAEQFGANSSGSSGYMFTTAEYATSLKDSDVKLYNITFIRDCVDANEFLDIAKYRLGNFHTDEGKLFNFIPCCALYHGDAPEDCLMCDKNFKVEYPKDEKYVKPVESVVMETSVDDVDLSEWEAMDTDKTKITFSPNDLETRVIHKQQNATGYHWERSEDKEMLTYIIKNKLIPVAKSSITFKRMLNDGVLAYRSTQSLMCRFRHVILPNIKSYRIPEPYEGMFLKLHLNSNPLAPKAYARFEEWEDQLMIDYLIETNSIQRSKHESVFHEMHADNVLRHRTVASLYTRMRQRIIGSIRKYKIPPSAIKEFESLQKGSGCHSNGKLWDEEEDRILLDYVVKNVDSLWKSKGRPLYDKMITEGYLVHRTPDGLRSRMTNHILRKIERYNLPEDILQKFIEFRTNNKYDGRLLDFKRHLMRFCTLNTNISKTRYLENIPLSTQISKMI